MRHSFTVENATIFSSTFDYSFVVAWWTHGPTVSVQKVRGERRDNRVREPSWRISDLDHIFNEDTGSLEEFNSPTHG